MQLSRGFNYWKNATISFRQHERSICHKTAIESLYTLPATCSNVGEMLCKNLAIEKANNRHCLKKIVTSLKFLARQGNAIRGHDVNEGNLMQLMQLLSQDDPKVSGMSQLLKLKICQEMYRYIFDCCIYFYT